MSSEIAAASVPAAASFLAAASVPAAPSVPAAVSVPSARGLIMRTSGSWRCCEIGLSDCSRRCDFATPLQQKLQLFSQGHAKTGHF